MVLHLPVVPEREANNVLYARKHVSILFTFRLNGFDFFRCPAGPNLRSVVEIIEGVYCIGGPDITDPRDCQVYLISAGERLALIDAGVGPSYDLLVANIRRLGFDPMKLALLVLTHAHIDHVGAASRFKEDYGPAIVAHHLDAQHLKEGDEEFTASNWYGLPPPVVRVDSCLLYTSPSPRD